MQQGYGGLRADDNAIGGSLPRCSFERRTKGVEKDNFQHQASESNVIREVAPPQRQQYDFEKGMGSNATDGTMNAGGCLLNQGVQVFTANLPCFWDVQTDGVACERFEIPKGQDGRDLAGILDVEL